MCLQGVAKEKFNDLFVTQLNLNYPINLLKNKAEHSQPLESLGFDSQIASLQ